MAKAGRRVAPVSNLAWMASVCASDFHFADDGSYIVATSPTIGTGATWVPAMTTFTDVSPNFYVLNNDPSRPLWLRRLKLLCSAVGTGATSWAYAVILDTARTISLDNTQTITPTMPNVTAMPLVAPLTLPTIKVQNNTVASTFSASTGNKIVVARGTLGGLNISQSEFEVIFGAYEAGGFPSAAEVAGQPSRKVTQSPPVIISPLTACSIYVWGAGSTASINPEWEMSLIAR